MEKPDFLKKKSAFECLNTIDYHSSTLENIQEYIIGDFKVIDNSNGKYNFKKTKLKYKNQRYHKKNLY